MDATLLRLYSLIKRRGCTITVFFLKLIHCESIEVHCVTQTTQKTSLMKCKSLILMIFSKILRPFIQTSLHKAKPCRAEACQCKLGRSADNVTFRHFLNASVFLGMLSVPFVTHAQTLDVMHWWTSASERSAANALAQAFNSHGLQWQDAAVEGGGGGAAVKVLKSRVLSGSPPAAAQIIGTMLTDWADMGLVLPLTRVAAQEAWKQQIFPEVLHLVTHKHQPIAVPLGIHRINSVLYQRTIFDKLEMPPPRDWAALEGVARRLRNAGITPIAWSDENWQVATVFEAVLLSYAGPELYERLVRARHPEAWLDRRVESALNRLRWLRDLNGPMQRQESDWIDNVKAFHAGRFGILMNGDWVRGELLALTGSSDSSSYCAPMPGTEGMHLYSIDTLSMLKGSISKQSEQEKAAALLTSVTLQRSYNRVKGSVPVLKDIDPKLLDSCAHDSWSTFANPRAHRVPSLAHRMAASEATKEAVAGVLQRFVLNGGVSAQQTQQQLAAVMRTLLKENSRK
jgi:glucose/mannose transport system substrate-binding protein